MNWPSPHDHNWCLGHKATNQTKPKTPSCIVFYPLPKNCIDSEWDFLLLFMSAYWAKCYVSCILLNKRTWKVKKKKKSSVINFRGVVKLILHVCLISSLTLVRFLYAFLTINGYTCADPEGGTGGRNPPPLKNKKNIGFLSNIGPNPWKITELPKQLSMLGQHRHARKRHLNGVRWRADDGPLIVVFGSYLPSSKKTTSKLDPLWQNFLDPRML